MKFSKIFVIAFFITICSFSAYSNSHDFIKLQNKALADTQQKARTVHTITITNHHPDGTLDLKNESDIDATSITVASDDDIVWTNTDPSITIFKIRTKHSTKNHFKNKPAQATWRQWQGRAENNTDSTVHEAKYFIKWEDKNGKTRKYDPLIKINPTSFETKS